MNLQDEPLMNAQGGVQQQATNDTKPNAYRVDDDDNVDEASLRKNYGIGGQMKNANAPGMEGEGMGGHKFGGTSNPPTGDDPANPSRNAGYTNGYLAKTEPSEEVPENNNFKSQHQEGEPDYHTAKSPSPTQQNNQQGESSIGEQSNTSEPGKADYHEEYRRGPDYGSDAPEIPGPNEKPDQQKVGGA